jgi:hypothetical protein
MRTWRRRPIWDCGDSNSLVHSTIVIPSVARNPLFSSLFPLCPLRPLCLLLSVNSVLEKTAPFKLFSYRRAPLLLFVRTVPPGIYLKMVVNTWDISRTNCKRKTYYFIDNKPKVCYKVT